MAEQRDLTNQMQHPCGLLPGGKGHGDPLILLPRGMQNVNESLLLNN